MHVRFTVVYSTHPGKSLYVAGTGTELGNFDIKKALKMKCFGTSLWVADINLPATTHTLEYKYILATETHTEEIWEDGRNRRIDVSGDHEFVHLKDSWRNHDNALNALESSAMKNVILRRNPAAVKPAAVTPPRTGEKNITFNVRAPKLIPTHEVRLLGGCPELGDWDRPKALRMEEIDPFTWKLTVKIKDSKEPVTYKYCIYDTVTGTVVSLETGEDRTLDYSAIKSLKILRVDDLMKYSNFFWKGAGVAIPVFSLRSRNGMGVGEFNDIKLLVDWCKLIGINMIQILPVNDTVNTHTWVDSYPYSGISMFALHPIYLHVNHLGAIPSETTTNVLNERTAALNQLETVDYEAVMKIKSRIYKMTYDLHKTATLKDPEFIRFFDENKFWLVPYAAYSYLRDLYGSADFSKWEKYARYDKAVIDNLVSPKTKHYDDIAIHYYIQYHLHKQLLEAAEYARANGVVLKGDIPIGVNRHGIDAWSQPHIFHLDMQTGAPPDDFAADGQNWGFPTYNWDEMAKDGYLWWRQRLQHLSKYFDAFRIDHILGFFRIWEIPYDSVSGLLGHFSPAIPVDKSEFVSKHIDFNEQRFCEPYITEEMILKAFPIETDKVKEKFFSRKPDGMYEFKSEYNTQRKIENSFNINENMTIEEKVLKTTIRDKLFSLTAEILFIRDARKNSAYHPRIDMKKTMSYKALPNDVQERLYQIYVDYFYRRQESLWKKQALIKLPALMKATDMLVCGEDLGMVPDCVPGVMDTLSILSLKIQRMPKEDYLTFGIPSNYPYLAVCTPSCHDMSTIRGWWEENREKTQKFYNEVLRVHGQAPYYCEPWISQRIIEDHLRSPCMWAVFPIQDLTGIDASVKREKPADERINIPSIPKYYWRYRFHFCIEDLLEKNDFNLKVKEIIKNSGRNTVEY